jgi:hypothetical protein
MANLSISAMLPPHVHWTRHSGGPSVPAAMPVRSLLQATYMVVLQPCVYRVQNPFYTLNRTCGGAALQEVVIQRQVDGHQRHGEQHRCVCAPPEGVQALVPCNLV